MRRSTRRSAPKRQSRLAFTPLPTSSSPNIEQSPGTGSERVANVRYFGPDSSPLSSKVTSKPQPVASPTPKQSKTTTVSSSDEESVRGPDSVRRAPKRPVVEITVDDDSSESDDIVTSSPTKRRRNVVRPRRISDSNKSQGTESDLEDVADQGSDTPVTKSRTRGRAADSAAKTRRREQLEALRRRRAGEQVEDTSRSPPPELLGNLESEESSDEELAMEEKDSDIESVVPEDLDKYEEDFVLQDDDAQLGAPAELQDMPFEFSRHRYKRLRDHFKDVVEWMVHNRLNPAFPRNDQIYRVAFAKVKDEVTGVAGSQLVSTVWNIDFKRALEARPGIEVSGFPVSAGHPCDACNRSKHPASYDIRFDGKPYSSETLESLSDEGESNSDESGGGDEHGSGNVDSEGHEIPDSSIHFYLGRHCKAKATMAHTLIHWRHHLNDWVIDYLQRQDVFTDANILERERWSQKRRTKFANETVDMLEEDGEIDRLWRDFNLNLKTARGTKESRW